MAAHWELRHSRRAMWVCTRHEGVVSTFPNFRRSKHVCFLLVANFDCSQLGHNLWVGRQRHVVDLADIYRQVVQHWRRKLGQVFVAPRCPSLRTRLQCLACCPSTALAVLHRRHRRVVERPICCPSHRAEAGLALPQSTLRFPIFKRFKV